ncbi:FKBP-type peptidyl-prolyl cis-trans isomerase [Alysiella crassa]|uniref:Peptidyl-prolyl cis-trans isomerase n=1 Tax=Alysiella crassa TaxID=153491 RepID=A0A376BS83_9NEIS|nr:FKBP-type peptidyl-prolyl cis-trans isomerase [Alysiella crassa]UOP07852.1 FKBP-type peptidyl-prolyl cis-trans isomerase [Alysiella crassa]SSY79711.1 Probable FKBP-type peptidyl-prolyl cis-trans isomerase [Alysiella crassa]
MKKTFLAMILAAASGLAFADDDVKLSEQQQKDLSYLMGYEAANMVNKLPMQAIMQWDKQEIWQGLQDALDNKAARVNKKQHRQLLLEIERKLDTYHHHIAQENLTKGEQFLAQNKTQADIHTTASGLQYRVDKAGSGARVKLGDTVSVFYTGKLWNGTVFAQVNEQPFTHELTPESMIAGWVEGLQLMQKGGEYTLFIPANLAFGESSVGAYIKPNSMLIFEIKVADIQATPSKKKTSPKAKRK